MNKKTKRKLIALFAILGISVELLSGCALAPSEVETQNITQKEKKEETVEQYEAAVVYNGNTATIYDGFSSYYRPAYSSELVLRYTGSNDIIILGCVFYSQEGLTQDGLYEFVSKQVGENGTVIYYNDEINILIRGN